MPNTFSDDPRRVEYDRNRTQKNRLEKHYGYCFLALVCIGGLLAAINLITTVLRIAKGDHIAAVSELLMIAGTVVGALGIHKKHAVMSIIALLMFVCVAVFERDLYFMLFAGIMGYAVYLHKAWGALEQAEGFPDFDYSRIEQEFRTALEHNAVQAILSDRPISDLTERHLPPAEAAPAEQPKHTPGEMHTI